MSLCSCKHQLVIFYILEIETARTLSDTVWTEAGTWAVGSAGVEWGAWLVLVSVVDGEECNWIAYQ